LDPEQIKEIYEKGSILIDSKDLEEIKTEKTFIEKIVEFIKFKIGGYLNE
jgi:hypothetical protein